MRVLTEGTRLVDRYTLIRRLGRGGASPVWLARDSRADAEVVLKFLRAGDASTEADRDRLQREWRIGSRLMHPNIARVFEYHDDAADPFYAQQYISGPDAGVLAGHPATDALRPFGLLADALRYAHGKHFVHRDIKASNVLLDHRGLPYLVDFGVATAAGDREADGGTPIAASPQQLAGDSPTPADDIYALGVLLHETLTGRPPDGKTPVFTTLVDAKGAPVPDALVALLRHMLAGEAGNRPDAARVGEALRAAGIEPGPAPARLLGKAPAADTLVAIEAVPTRRRQAPAMTDTTAAGSDRGVRPIVVWGGLALLVAAVVTVFLWLPQNVDQGRRDDAGDTAETSTPDPDTEEAGDPAAADASSRSAGAAESSDPATRAATDEILGELLSKLERLKLRGIERWGGQAYLAALEIYEEGDRAFLERDYRLAGERYRAAIELIDPFFGRIDKTFSETLQAAGEAFARGDHAEAVRLYDLAVAITPGHQGAQAGLARARNLKAVLDLTEQGLRLENERQLEASREALQAALDLDAAWQPARTALARVREAIVQRSFEQRMTEGLEAFAAGNYPSARASFEAAKALRPTSRQPVDGLLQVDQEVRLAAIRRMEQEAGQLEESEQWQEAIAKYEEVLEVDSDLQFARAGLANARARAAIHERLQGFISSPDSLSAPATMQAATRMLLQVSRITPMGPRLEDQKDELSRLLKRAATPLTVQFVSDNATDVSIYQVGHLGSFAMQELTLRPGAYVALGSRPGFRDVRLEFRVAPEIDMEPIVIKCEERI